jgi:predicted phage gp36 major capsid-like protein
VGDARIAVSTDDGTPRPSGHGPTRNAPRAAREREELRADLRARAERAEHEADACRAELARIRAEAGHDDGAAKTPRRGQRAANPQA